MKVSGAKATWLREGMAGCVVAILSIVSCQSFGALVFAARFPEAVSLGTQAALATGLVAGMVVALRSRFPGVVATPQERIAPILALLTTVVVQELPEDVPNTVKVWTVMAAIASTSLIVGLSLYALGRLRLGNLTRYIPYPVVGGFLAGSGWLLVVGAVRVTTGLSAGPGDVVKLLQPAVAAHWLPALAMGGLLLWAIRIRRQPPVFIAVLTLALPAFYVILLAGGIPVETARLHGWLPPATQADAAPPGLWSPGALAAVRWDLLPGMAGIIGSVLVTSALSILLNASGIELLARSEIDLNRELRAAGVANLASGAVGGMVGFHSLNFTRLTHDVGARGRLPAWIAAIGCGVALVAGPAPAGYVPGFVLGGLLSYLGLGFLHDWVLRARRRLSRADYAVVLLILGVIGTFGYVEGVAFGLLSALILFVHKYSRVSVITHALTGADHPSNVDRPPAQRRLLEENGGAVLVLRLQGFIFFGTANSILQQIRQRAETRALVPLRFVILDFRRVSGLDSSASFSLSRSLQIAEKHQFILVFTHLSADMRNQLRDDVFRTDVGPWHRILPNLDLGVEWCEQQLLGAENAGQAQAATPLRDLLAGAWSTPGTLDAFLPYLERQECPAGEFLIRQGAAAEDLYFVESGELTTALETSSGLQRLRRQGPGTVVGELGLVLGVPRTASVVADTPCVVHRLTAQNLEAMQRDAPEAAADFHRFLTHHLAERLVNSNRILRALMD